MKKKYPLSFFVVASIAVAFSLLCSCDKSIWDNRWMEGGSEKSAEGPIGLGFEGEEPGEESDSGSEIEWKYGMSLDGGSIKDHGDFCNEPGPFSGYTPNDLVKHVAELMWFVVPLVSKSLCAPFGFIKEWCSCSSGFAVKLGDENLHLFTCMHGFQNTPTVREGDSVAEKTYFAGEVLTRLGQVYSPYMEPKIEETYYNYNGNLKPPFTKKELKGAMKDVWGRCKEVRRGEQRLSFFEKGENPIKIEALPGDNGDIYPAGYQKCCKIGACIRDCSSNPVLCDLAVVDLGRYFSCDYPPELSSFVELAYAVGAKLVIGSGEEFTQEDLRDKAIAIVAGYPGSYNINAGCGRGYTSSRAEGHIHMGRILQLEEREHRDSKFTVVHYNCNTLKGSSGGPIFILVQGKDGKDAKWRCLYVGAHTHRRINGSGVCFTKKQVENILGLSSPEFKEFNKRGPKEWSLREEREREAKDVECLLSRFSETMQDNFVNPDEALRLWTSNCCFADAVLKILTKSGAIGDDIYESKDEICRLIATFIDLNRSGKPFPEEKMQELLRLYEISEGSIYGFEQQEWCFHFFNKISKRLFTECELFKKNFELCYDASCRCSLTVTRKFNEASLFFPFNEKCEKYKVKKSIKALNRPRFIAVGSSESLCEQEFENIEVQHQDETMLHYELKSFVVYSSNGDSGHYWAYAKLPDGNYCNYNTLGTAANTINRAQAYREFKNSKLAIYELRV